MVNKLTHIGLGFRPDVVFYSLYRNSCRAAWESHQNCNPCHNGLSPHQHCDAVLVHLDLLVSQMGPQRSSRAIRMEVLARVGTRWPALNAPTACLFCLCRSTEHMMPCGHAMCDTCVTIYGNAVRTAEYHVGLDQCPICRSSFQATVRQLPPTKRPVAITLDGGGIRGIVTLGLLRALERRLHGVIKLPEIPDLFAGTSVGALFNLPSMFLCCSSALIHALKLGCSRQFASDCHGF